VITVSFLSVAKSIMAARLVSSPRTDHSSGGVSAGVLIGPVATSDPNAPNRPSRLAVALAFGGAIAVAVALVLVAVVFRSGADNAGAPVETATVDFTGIPQDGAILGDANAKVTLIEYADLQCPGCRHYALTMFPSLVESHIRPGKAKTEFRGYPFIGDDSLKAQRFVTAAGLQDRLWNLQEALYRNQGAENSGWVTDELIRELASEIPGLDVDKLFADAESNEVAAKVQQGITQAQAAGVPGTPTFFIAVDGEEPYMLQSGLTTEQMGAALDDALGS
jgi:protein-disulfide isomerase